jgi:hypothetical protein
MTISVAHAERMLYVLSCEGDEQDEDGYACIVIARRTETMENIENATLRGLTSEEQRMIRKNASGDDVFCGTAADAEMIARGACDRDDEWSPEAVEEAIVLAQTSWSINAGSVQA